MLYRVHNQNGLITFRRPEEVKAIVGERRLRDLLEDTGELTTRQHEIDLCISQPEAPSCCTPAS